LLEFKERELLEAKSNIKRQEDLINQLKGVEAQSILYKQEVNSLHDEIERLNSQHRYSLEMADQQKHSLNHKIQELMDQLHAKSELENRQVYLQGEMDRLNSLLKQKMNEIEDWRAKYQHLEFSHGELQGTTAEIQRLNEQLRHQGFEMESYRTKLQEANDAISRLQLQNKNLNAEIEEF